MEALLEQITQLRDAVEEAQAEKASSEGEGTAPPAAAENSTIKAIRAEAKRAEKRAAEAEAKVVELAQFKEETVAAQRQAVLAHEGLTARQAEAFLAMGTEVTPETVRAFKSEVLGVSADPEGEGTVPSAPFAPAGFTPEKPEVVVEGSDKVREFVEKHGADAAAKAWAEGKLKV
jgi:hypothetical protein